MNSVETERPYYRWYILFLGMMSYLFIAGLSRMCMPVLFKEISDDLGLNMLEIGAVWGMDPLAGVFIALPGGLIVDRFGVRRTMFFISIFAGIFGALRGFSVGFISMAVTMYLFGLMAATMPSIVPKVTAEWFRGKELGLTNAMLNVVWAFGSMAATMLSANYFSPFFGGWRRVMFVYGIPCILLGLLWIFTGRDKPVASGASKSPASHSLLDAFRHVVKIREVWVIAFITTTYWGSSMGLTGYLPTYLKLIGWTPFLADSATTVMTGIASLGTIPVVLISDRLGARKGVLIVSTIMMAVTVFALPLFKGTFLWVLIILTGLTRTGVAALFNVMVIELKEVGSEYSGTAIGLTSTLGMVGAFLAPPVGNSLEAFNNGYPFIFWAVLAAAGLPFFAILKNK
ncbi:MAG: MFS transporter [Desulfatiglans sp.]|nr:MFS transporter [Desulfatiglans sp.]